MTTRWKSRHGGRSGSFADARPSPSQLRELVQLGEIGYIRGIETKLAEMAEDPAYRPFAEALGQYVKAFDMAGYARFLEGMKTETADG